VAGVRFYLPFYRDMPDRPVYFEDLGNVLKLSGIVLQGMGSTVVLMSRQMEIPDPFSPHVVWASPGLEEWAKIIAQTDDPELFVGDASGVTKILHRRQRYSISGEVQQKIWARDGFKCVYCGAKMGEALMTIDHFIPLERGGLNDERNYLTACRKCNKRKGVMDPEAFCNSNGYNFLWIVQYLSNFYQERA